MEIAAQPVHFRFSALALADLSSHVLGPDMVALDVKSHSASDGVGERIDNVRHISRELWNGMEWNGMEWNGMEWNGMEWNGMEWNGMEWNGMEWNGMEWNGMEWNGMEWNGMESHSRCHSGRRSA